MKVKNVITDMKTGETIEEWVYLPGVVTEEEQQSIDKQNIVIAAEASLIAQMDTLDIRHGVRALTDAMMNGDWTYLKILEEKKQTLRKQLQK